MTYDNKDNFWITENNAALRGSVFSFPSCSEIYKGTKTTKKKRRKRKKRKVFSKIIDLFGVLFRWKK